MTDKDRNSEIERLIWREKLQDHLLVLTLIFVLFGFAIASVLYISPGSVEFKKATIEKVGFGHGDSGGFPIYAAKTLDGKYLPHVSRSLDMPAALSVG